MKNYIYGFGSCFFLMAAIAIRYIWPPELNLVFNSLFLSSTLLLALCAFIVGHLFYTKGGSSRNSRFYFGLGLVVSTSFMYTGFEEIASNVAFWKPHFSAAYSSFFLLLTQFIIYAKNIVSFGFAALGANIAANAIIEK